MNTDERTQGKNHQVSGFTRAVRYLSLQARSEAEVRRYLARKEYSQEEIDEAVEKLMEYNYLDDFGYCQTFYRQAVMKNKGRRRIETELLGKGVGRQVVKEAIEALLEEEDGLEISDEKGRALEVGRKMARQQADSGKLQDEKFSAKVARRLAGLGYSTSIVYYVLDRLRAEAREQEEDWQDD